MEEYNTEIRHVDIDIVNSYDQNLLQEAIAYKREAISYDLINRGINLNHLDEQGRTALHYCAVYHAFDVAKAILDKGCDVNIRDQNGNNALWVAVFNARGVYDIVELFVKHGADITNKNNAGRTPLDFAKQIEDNDLVKTLQGD